MVSGPLTTREHSGRRAACRRLRSVLLLAAGIALLAAYIGSYYYLSRRGMREAKAYNMKGFLYVPAAEALAEKNLNRHHTLAILYAPLNEIDQIMFGSDGPVRCVLWGLNK